jgi:anhydro-N-acetylmuramic acid kinase
VLATATALTAESVAHGLRSAGVGGAAGALGAEVIAGGGGTRNPVLMAELGRRLPGQIVTTHSAFGVDSQAKEALSFAVLAAAAIRGQVNTVPACTGARQAVVMGKIVPGQNYGRLMASLFGTSGSP